MAPPPRAPPSRSVAFTTDIFTTNQPAAAPPDSPFSHSHQEEPRRSFPSDYNNSKDMPPPPLQLDKWDIVLGTKSDHDINMGTRVWKMICDLTTSTEERKQKFLDFRRQIANDPPSAVVEGDDDDNNNERVRFWMEQIELFSSNTIESDWILDNYKSFGEQSLYREVTVECAMHISGNKTGSEVPTPPTTNAFINTEVAATADTVVKQKPTIVEKQISDNSTTPGGRLQLKVFQASPLAYENTPIPFLDLDEEESILREALEDTYIDVSFEVATAHGISTFLAQGQRFLHLSCHGHPQQLFIEDGYGGCHLLVVGENLKKWITVGGQVLHFVFVSACHSRSVGEAFCDAGVPYVVCCQQDGHQLLDQAARIFARGFYSAVANGLDLPQAYELAKNEVIQSPEIHKVAGIDPETEAKKFIMLTKDRIYKGISLEETTTTTKPGEGGKASVSFRRHSSIMLRKDARKDRLKAKLERLQSYDSSGNNSSTTSTAAMLPVPPQPFLERELVMYQILKALFIERRKVRLVRIKGEKGVGKVALAKAVAQYIKKRNMWGPILWLPPPSMRGSADHQSSIFDLEKSSIAQAILETYTEEKAILIIDATKFASQEALTSLCRFLDDVFERTKYVKVIVIESANPDSVIESQRWGSMMGFLVPEKLFELQRLSVEGSVFLFCHSCPYVRAWFKSMRILQQKLETDENAALIFGLGNPTRILLMAKVMSKPEFDKLLEAGTPINMEDFAHSLSRVEETMAAEDNGLTRQSSRDSCQSFDLGNVMLSGSNDGNPPPLRTQEEIIDRFIPILKSENRVYRKTVRSFIRKAVKGEHIVSIINGVKTTEQTVEDDRSWVVCGQVAGEFYIISDEKLKEIYDTEHPDLILDENEYLHKQGYKAYQPVRQVYAHKVNSSDMDFFRCGSSVTTREAHFMAPWGTPVRVELGDYILLQYPDGQDDIYPNDCNLFQRTYADIHQSRVSAQQANDLRARTLNLREQMTEYRQKNPSFADLDGDIRHHLHNLMGVLDKVEQQGRRKPSGIMRMKTT